MTNDVHPWASEPEAIRAARVAVAVPARKMPKACQRIGYDELFSEALLLLAECAAPKPEPGRRYCAACDKPLDSVRVNAKFCSPQCRYGHANGRRVKGTPLSETGTQLEDADKTHVGSMWTWPEDRRSEFAAREIGMRLWHYVVCHPYVTGRERIDPAKVEAPSARAVIDPPSVGADAAEARGALEELLPAKLVLDGKESGRDLLEAIVLSRGLRLEGDESDAELAEAVSYIVRSEV